MRWEFCNPEKRFSSSLNWDPYERSQSLMYHLWTTHFLSHLNLLIHARVKLVLPFAFCLQLTLKTTRYLLLNLIIKISRIVFVVRDQIIPDVPLLPNVDQMVHEERVRVTRASTSDQMSMLAKPCDYSACTLQWNRVIGCTSSAR